MAFTYTRIPDADDIWGRNRIRYVDVTITGTYTTGGYTINATDVGLKFFRGVDVEGGDVSLGTYNPVVNLGTSPAGSLPSTFKLAFYTATGVPATGTLSPSINIRLRVTGQ